MSEPATNLRVRGIGRYDRTNQLLRLLRLTWQRGTVGDGQGYSAKLSVGLRSSWFRWQRDSATEWRLTIAGVRIHYGRAYGGLHG